jgi:hypothetical protein
VTTEVSGIIIGVTTEEAATSAHDEVVATVQLELKFQNNIGKVPC